jgi:hypothetical protein
VYHDYFDDTDTSGLRNPYGPEVPLLPGERGSYRQRLLLLGMVGAGLSVVAPAAGSGALPGSGRVAAAPERPQTGVHRADEAQHTGGHGDVARADDRS